MSNTRRDHRVVSRRALFLIWYVAGSFVGAIALAVGIALFSPEAIMLARLQTTDDADQAWWNAGVPTGDRVDWEVRGQRRQTTFPGLEIIDYKAIAYSPETGQPETATATRVNAGWPFPCLTGSSWYLMPASSPPGSPIIFESTAFRVETDSGPRVVPWWPRPWGLLLDAAVMGVLVGAGPAAWFLARRIERLFRGKCPACGYPAGGTRCSECGRVGRYPDPVPDASDRSMLTGEP